MYFNFHILIFKIFKQAPEPLYSNVGGVCNRDQILLEDKSCLTHVKNRRLQLH